MKTMKTTFMTVIGATVLAAAAVSLAQAPAAKPAAAAPGLNVLVAGAKPVAGKTCKLEISSSDAMQFDKKELKIAADCKNVELTLKHSGRLPAAAMGHNWVLTKTADAQAVNSAGMAAGIKNQHVPAGDKRVIAATQVIGGGQTTVVRFATTGLVQGGDYTYFCSFPGHFAIMKGKLIVG